MTRALAAVRVGLSASFGCGRANHPGEPALIGCGVSLIRMTPDNGPVVGVKLWAADVYVWAAPLWWKRRGWLLLDVNR